MSEQTSINQMLSRWMIGLDPPAWLGVEVGLLGVALALALRLLPWGRPQQSKLPSAGFAALVAALGVRLALQQAWLADDAFISFRYARNLAEGHGLVFNLGERVEGYTNFLWTLLLALGHRLGARPELVSTALTLGSLAAVAVVGSWKLSRPGWVPLGPVLLAVSPAFVEFGTSGLEAAPAAMCIGFCALWLGDAGRRAAAGWWVLAAALLRPDHALFFLPLGPLQLRAGRRALLHTAGAGLGFFAYWLGRWAYFGEFFPNTFHAKSGGGAYWGQGFLYWAEFSLATGLFLAIPLVLAVAVVLALSVNARAPLPRASLLFSVAGAALMAAYVARVGGDFMEFRFGLTSLVLVAFGADALLSTLASERAWGTALAGLALLPLGLTPSLVKSGEKKWYLARESSFYRVKTWSPLEIDSVYWRTGQALATLPEQGARAPSLAAGCVGMVGYLFRGPIIDRYGLTNTAIARKAVKERGRPGHEKWASNSELMGEGAQWSIDPGWPGLLDQPTRLRLQGVEFWMLRHTAALDAVIPLAEPSQVLSVVTSPEEALEHHEALSTLYQEQPEPLNGWRERWGLLDARQLEVKGEGVEIQPWAVAGQERLTLSLSQRCSQPRLVRWSVARGECSAKELRCLEGEPNPQVVCTKAAGASSAAATAAGDIRLEGFTSEPLELKERLRRAQELGFGAMATLLRRERRSTSGAAQIPGVTRLGFDEASLLESPQVLEIDDKVFNVTLGPAPGQGAITGMEGSGLLNGYALGDAPKGRVRLGLPVEPGKRVLVSFLFAGGSDCQRIYALLRDGPLSLLKVCGRQDEVLRPFTTAIIPQSQSLELEVVDEHEGAWGHALLDDVLVWSLPPVGPGSGTASETRNPVGP